MKLRRGLRVLGHYTWKQLHKSLNCASSNVQVRCSSSDVPCMPPCEFKPQQYKGLSYDETLKVRGEHIHRSMSLYYKKPLLIHQGHMQWVWDQNGKRYLDMFAGIVTVSVGHCHPKVVQAGVDQMQKLWHTTNIYLHPKIHEYSAKLTSKLPSHLKVCLFCNSGSEANDVAMLMARLYTGAYDIVSLRNAYHGASPYSSGLCGISSWKHMVAGGFGIHHAMNPDPYKGLWGGKHCRDSPLQTDHKCSCAEDGCKACDMYIEQLNEMLTSSVTNKRIAAFFSEAIQGVGGTVQFPKGYLQKAYKIIRDKGGICVADEVQTGFGRLGTHYWGFETHGVMPDIVTMAKGIGNGFPLAAVVTTPEIAASLTDASYFNTFGGNPLACAVGSAVLDVIEEDGLQQHCHDLGTHLLREFQKLEDEFDVVGDIRGKGLMLGVELVKDKASKAPLEASQVNSIFEDICNMGVLVGKGGAHSNVFRIKPPMCITKEDADFCVAVLRNALQNHQQRTK